MQSVFVLEHFEQLKALSDPLRAKMMMYLIEKPHTGQQLAEKMDMSRAKIHYHLRELEKNDLINIVRKEEKNGILQKFYRSVAWGFIPGDHLLPHKSEVGELGRRAALLNSERAKARILAAPDEAFNKPATSDPKDWGFIGTQAEAKITEEQFKEWCAKYISLLEELEEMETDAKNNKEAKLYYFMKLAFQIDHPLFTDGEEG